MMRHIVLSLAAASVCWMASASSAITAEEAPQACPVNGRAMARTELFFGTDRMRRPPVSSAQWNRFVALEIAKRFPSGFTVVDARGHWRGSKGKVVAERSHVLIIWHDGSAVATDKLEALRAIWKSRFTQDAVLRVDSRDCAAF